jgi:hypothetical protein
MTCTTGAAGATYLDVAQPRSKKSDRKMIGIKINFLIDIGYLRLLSIWFLGMCPVSAWFPDSTVFSFLIRAINPVH